MNADKTRINQRVIAIAADYMVRHGVEAAYGKNRTGAAWTVEVSHPWMQQNTWERHTGYQLSAAGLRRAEQIAEADGDGALFHYDLMR